MIKNVYGVKPSVWRRWTHEGKLVFNYACAQLGTRVPGWNAAFVAACEASGLNVEYEGRE